MKDISILGCGWLGLPLAKRLLKTGYNVNGTTTTPDKLSALKSFNITPYLLDITADEFPVEFLNSETLIILITSKDISAFKRLIQHIETSSVKHVIYISSTSVYSNCNSVVTEEHPTNDSPLVSIENLFRNSSKFKTTIIRFGGLFGYKRQPGNFIRSHNTIPNPEGYVNLIHQDDCVEILSLFIEKNIQGEIFNACADSHPKRADYYTKEMAKVGRMHPILDKNSSNEYKIISPEKLITYLNFKFKYGDLMAF
ncbi:dTDP-glucose 4,6-dehydratase [Formosa agariphila KMM 3901]|uniref:dTDP-glucose 4,6-dehydratase n=1 Tax=Formosa agariphila (strain DSM 15362 / KCTC 12365 / LMG 23005 / KMM 3901 / M-2Alg 35-1) TaxID=1347342 RepID=T2KH97_FORAG|nr:NAD(P)-binding domain-containing protein [Formosa agariphila]CDF78175.1 dTDP-glucose 4,6-dehydratase [Formosa agariphila KMM 3901]